MGSQKGGSSITQGQQDRAARAFGGGGGGQQENASQTAHERPKPEGDLHTPAAGGKRRSGGRGGEGGGGVGGVPLPQEAKSQVKRRKLETTRAPIPEQFEGEEDAARDLSAEESLPEALEDLSSEEVDDSSSAEGANESGARGRE